MASAVKSCLVLRFWVHGVLNEETSRTRSKIHRLFLIVRINTDIKYPLQLNPISNFLLWKNETFLTDICIIVKYADIFSYPCQKFVYHLHGLLSDRILLKQGELPMRITKAFLTLLLNNTVLIANQITQVYTKPNPSPARAQPSASHLSLKRGLICQNLLGIYPDTLGFLPNQSLSRRNFTSHCLILTIIP